jgi:hypothetical protein
LQSIESDLKNNKQNNFSAFPITNKEELEDALNDFLKAKANNKNIKKHSVTNRVIKIKIQKKYNFISKLNELKIFLKVEKS